MFSVGLHNIMSLLSLSQVTKAEAFFTAFVAKHNIPFSAANHFSKLTSAMFPDSQVARKYSSARTKTTMMLRGIVGLYFRTMINYGLLISKNIYYYCYCSAFNDRLSLYFMYRSLWSRRG